MIQEQRAINTIIMIYNYQFTNTLIVATEMQMRLICEIMRFFKILVFKSNLNIASCTNPITIYGRTMASMLPYTWLGDTYRKTRLAKCTLLIGKGQVQV